MGSTTIEPDTTAAGTRVRRRIPWRRVIAINCWVMVIGWALFAIVRVFGLERSWYATLLMPFTPYIAMLSLLPLILAVFLRRWRAVTVAVLATLALGTVFLPRLVGQPDPGHGPTLHVMSQNMKLGGADPAAIVALVRVHHIDLLAVEEYTPAAEDALRVAGLTTLLPFSETHPLPYAVGSAIYSRYPLSGAGYQPLAGGYGQEYATVTVPGALPLEFYAVHTAAPIDQKAQGYWVRSLGQEPHATPKGTVRLLAGDFNATLDHARLRDLLGTGYTDVASQLGDGMVPTWPYDGRWFPPVPITLDHMFADPRIGAISFGAAAVKGTDHRAIYATLTLPAAPFPS